MEMKVELPPEIVENGIIGGPETPRAQGLGRPFLSIGLLNDLRVGWKPKLWTSPLGAACRGKRFGLRMRKIKPRDPVLIPGEVGVALRRGSDLRVEHRREKARDGGEDRRVRPAGLFAHQKRLIPNKGGKGIDVGSREFSLLALGMAPKSLQLQP